MKNRICIFLLLIMLVSACSEEAGSERYAFSSLYKLTVSNDISIRLIQDSANYIRISGPAGIVKHVIPSIEDDTIAITNSTKIVYYNQEVWADIHFTDFKFLLLYGGGEVINEDTIRFTRFSIGSNRAIGHVNLCLNSDNLSVGLSTGALDLNLTGHVKHASIWSTAPGFIDMLALEAETLNCTNSSSNDCYVWATKKLNAKADYSGDIYYKGNPESLIVPPGQEDKVISLD